MGCCQRPKISNGFLREAKEEGTILAKKLLPFIEADKKILVCEPSCASALNHDIPDLMDDEQLGKKLSDAVLPVAAFLHEKMQGGLQLPLEIKHDHIMMHGHCHEKSLYGTTHIQSLIKACGHEVELIDSGCCGMAGSFGYEKEHYALSEKIGDARLFSKVRKAPANTFVIANGFSCRHQLEHFANAHPRYWTEVFDLD